jgi:hypothetical protein
VKQKNGNKRIAAKVYYYFIKELSKFCDFLQQRSSSWSTTAVHFFSKVLLFDYPAGKLTSKYTHWSCSKQLKIVAT